ncbi:T9SS type A sorting domain-containing protein [bacterium]|nr:T9SS type A sorting domain-containing protein [bacterium]
MLTVNRLPVLVFLAVLLTVCSASANFTLWQPESGVEVRQSPHIRWLDTGVAEKADGSYAAVWSDAHLQVQNVFVQAYDSDGNPLWGDGGVQVTFDNWAQDSPKIIPYLDGWVVAWRDFRSCGTGDWDYGEMYMQRLDANGNLLWDSQGVAAADEFIQAREFELVASNDNQFFAVWTSPVYELGAQKFDADGNPQLDAPIGMSTDKTTAMISDNQGGLLIFWQDFHTGELFGSRIGSNGQFLWHDTNESLLITITDNRNHSDLSFAPDGEGGALVTWSKDTIHSDWDVLAQHIHADGTFEWDPLGVVVAGGSNGEYEQDVYLADSQTWFMLFHSREIDESHGPLYVQRIRSVDGECVLDWNDGAGVQIEGEPVELSSTARALPLGNGDVAVLWTASDYATNLVRLDDDGSTVWSTNAAIEDLYTYPGRYMMADDEQLRAVYQSQTPGSDGIYVSAFDLSDGVPDDERTTVVEGFANDTSDPLIVRSGSSAYTVWSDYRHMNRGRRPYMQRIDLVTGETRWTEHGIHLLPGYEDAEYDSIKLYGYVKEIVPDGCGGAITSWWTQYDIDFEPHTDCRLQRVDAAGNLLWGEDGVEVALHDNPAYNLTYLEAILPDHQGGAFVFLTVQNYWYDGGMWFNHIQADGSSAFADPQGIALFEWEDMVYVDDVVALENGNMMLFYHYGYDDHRPACVMYLNPDGEQLWPEPVEIRDLETHRDINRYETVVRNDGVLLIVMADNNNGSSIFFMQEIYTDGTVWLPDGPMDLAIDTFYPYVTLRDENTLWWGQTYGVNEILVQIFDIQTGQLTGNPVLLNTNRIWPRYPGFVPDGEGGLYAAWMSISDLDQLEFDGRYVHFAYDGSFASPEYTTEGLTFGVAPYEREDLYVAPDGLGGMLAVWNDYRGRLGFAPGDDVYAMRIHDMTTGVGEPSSAKVPLAWSLQPTYPNPFNPSTVVPFMLPHRAQVKIAVFDVLGREVATLLNEPVNGGAHQVIWNGDKTASGVYFVRMQADDFTATRRVVLMK